VPDTSIITIDEIVVGTVVRVLLPSSSKGFRPRNTGLFRVLDGGERTSINQVDWRRVVGLNRRKFVARVIENDVDNREITLVLEDSHTTNNRKIRYEVQLPYSSFLRVSRLVPQSRVFDSNEEELAFRRQNRQSAVNKGYFDAKDRFIGVELLAILGDTEMVINFTFQVGVSGSSFTVPLPANAVDDADYTVVSGYNTVVGAAAPMLMTAESSRTINNFLVATADGSSVMAGTTIDFVVKAR